MSEEQVQQEPVINQEELAAAVGEVPAVEGQEVSGEQGTEELTEEQTQQAHEDIEQFKQLFPELPENTELALVDGKVCLVGNINGVREALTLQDVVRNAMKYTAGDQLLEQAKEEKNRAKSITAQTADYMKYLIANPNEYYKQRRAMGIDDSQDHDFFADALEKRIAYEQMTPEQRELEELRQERAARQAELERQKKEQAEQAEQQEVRQLEEKYAGDIISALKANGVDTDADEVFKENIFRSTLYYMLVAEQQQVPNYTPTKAVAQVLRDTKANVHSIWGNMSADQIRATLPENVKKAIIGSDDPAGLTSIPTSKSLRGKGEPKPKEKKNEQPLGMNDFFNNL